MIQKTFPVKLRSGWEFVRADEYPNDDYPSSRDSGKYAGVIGVGGLVLARIPEELANNVKHIIIK